jgi:hypothetical protein
MAYRIQHLGLGGILDQAIAITKNHFGLLFGIMVCLLIPYQLIVNFAQLAIAPELPANPSFEDIMAAQREVAQFWPLSLAAGAVGLLLVIPVTNAAVIHAISKKYLGQDVSAGEAIKRGFALLLPLLGTTILMSLAIMGGLILLIIPGILFALWFGLAQHVVVIERLSGFAALKRSKQLVRPYLGTFLVLGIIVFVINFAIGLAAGLIPQPHLRAIIAVLLGAVTTAFSTAALVVFYFSCRCAVENFDLHYLAESIGGTPPPAADAEPHPTYGV